MHRSPMATHTKEAGLVQFWPGLIERGGHPAIGQRSPGLGTRGKVRMNGYEG